MISRLTKNQKHRCLVHHAHIVLPLAIIFFTPNTLAGENSTDPYDNIQINITAQSPILGDLNIQDELFLGTNFKYFLTHFGRHHLFLSGGYLTNSDNTGGSTEIFNIDVGSQFDLRRLWGKRNYIEYSAGITYTNEEYVFNFLDREVTNSFSDTSFKASLGYGFDFTRDVGTKISIDQYDNSTTLGFNFYYQF